MNHTPQRRSFIGTRSNGNDDEGFASSSSSAEEEQTRSVIRRKMAQSSQKQIQPRNAEEPLPKQVRDTKSMAPVERVLWISTFLWAFHRLSISELPTSEPSVRAELWVALLLVALGVCRLSSRAKRVSMGSVAGDRSSSATSSDDHAILAGPRNDFLHPSVNRYHGLSAKDNNVPMVPSNRIFGASRTSFRAEADEGLLCGGLLFPIVAAAMVVDAARQDVDTTKMVVLRAKLELVLLMSLICLFLVSVSGAMHPMKRIIRKRGLLVSSILVSAIVTYLITQMSPLTPILNRTPISLVIFSVTTLQWSLYVCVVALKRCFTLGEMCVISQAVALLVHGSLEYICATYAPKHVAEYIMSVENEPVMVLLHALVLGMLVIGLLTYPLLKYSRSLAQRRYWRSSPDALVTIQRKKAMMALCFYGVTAVIVLALIAPVCQTIMDENPFLWTLDFVFMSPCRLFICLYWTFTVASMVVVWVLVLDFSLPENPQYSGRTNDKALTSTLNKKRKLFHILAVVMFVPGVLFALPFLQLAFGVALAIFIYLEYIRYFAIWPYGTSIHLFLSEFIDNRDLGPVILSHIYLLLGCAGPVWLGSSNLLPILSGILSLGFGDAAASVVGKRFGRWRWPGTKKTVEGTAMFVVTVYASSVVIMHMAALVGVDSAVQFTASAGRSEWALYAVMVTLTSLLEAFSSQNDNIIIPLYMYALVVLGQGV